MNLTPHQQALLDGQAGEAAAMAMRILLQMARVEGAAEFVPITSAHIDGCLFHGATGVYFAERLKEGGGRVRVPTSLNVGAMDLRRPDNVLLRGRERELAIRQMNAYVAMGCTPSWTCAPYQAGFRPGPGDQVAWAESNAVVFANSVLGARTNRYGDFMDICCALTGYAPRSGLHIAENRRARVVVETDSVPNALKQREDFYPVLGAWLGRAVGSDIAVIAGLPADVTEDRLKALGASAASTGAVAMFHVAGVTPEAATLERALGGQPARRRIRLTRSKLRDELARMNTAEGHRLDLVALGSPHFSIDECGELLRLMAGREAKLPVYVCTGRHVIEALEARDWLHPLEQGGIRLVADTCVVVTPVIEARSGVLMTNSGKFAHYSPSLIGHQVAFGSLAECVESAVAGRIRRDPAAWGVP